MDFSASRDLRRGLVEVREVCGQGRGYFARPAASVAAGGATSVAAGARSSALPEGTVVMENTRPVVAAVNDQYEGRNCRQCLQPCFVSDDVGLKSSCAVCAVCQRWALCSACSVAAAAAAAAAVDAATNGVADTERMTDAESDVTINGNTDQSGSKATLANRHHGDSRIGSSSSSGDGADADGTSSFPALPAHDAVECQALVALSSLQRAQPELTASLLGGTTLYLRLLLQLLAMRARGQQASTRGGEDDKLLDEVDELEDHLDDLLDGGQMEGMMANTIQAAKMVAPAAWKASQDTCAEFLGKLYCNSMTVGMAGISAPLARRRYWSGIRGCLYTDFGVGLFPEGAMFNHSCEPNCAWQTNDSGSLRVVIVRSVMADEQLFISYVDILQPRSVRQDLLQKHFFFDCACRRCKTGSIHCRYDHPQETASPPLASTGSTRRHADSDIVSCVRSSSSNLECPAPVPNDDRSLVVDEDGILGGWVCPKRTCCRRGRVIRPGQTAGDKTGIDRWRAKGGTEGTCTAIGGFQGDGDKDGWGDNRGQVRTLEQCQNISWARCDTCGGWTGEAYFDRWTDLLGTRLTAADACLSSGDIGGGRRRLTELQVLCERRLSSTHAFALGVACRQMLAAAADSDWSGTVLYTDQAARRMSGIRKGLSAMSPDGEGSRSDSNGDSGDGSDGGGNTSVSRASVSRDALCATAIWEALVVEVLDHALPLAGRGYERQTELHKRRMVFVEQTAKVWGVERSLMVAL